MLKEKELEHELKHEPVWERRHEFFRLNPAGEVPVLVDEKGEIICGSYSITEYLEEIYPDVQCFGGTPGERAEVRRIVQWFDEKFDREVTQNILFEKIFKRLHHYGEPSSEGIRAGKRNILHHLDYLAHLLLARNWLAGEYMTLADITAAAHLSCLDYLGDVPWDHHQAVREWYAIIKSRPSFRELLADRITGFRPPPHYDDPDF